MPFSLSTMWLIACGIFMFIEILTTGFLIFWLGVGAFIAFIAASLGANLLLQVIIFGVVSSLLIIFMKPILDKFVTINNNPTNKDALLGKEAIVVSNFDALTKKGQVKLEGEIWTAIIESQDEVKVGQKVIVDKIDGVKLVVKTN